MRTNQSQHSHAQGACGDHPGPSEAHSHAGILGVLAGCDVVICSGMGKGAADALRSGGITEVRFTASGGPALLPV
jgi:hypothetical protein